MIDPACPDYDRTPASPLRPAFSYAPACPTGAPPVSIVTPYFNVGPVFHETAASVFRQSLQNWEWLIVNDGSTDPAALAVLDEYRRRDPRVRVIDLPENRGLPAARNEGYRHARAEYVFQLDGDDLIEPTMLEKCAWFLATHPGFAFVKGYSVGFAGQKYLWTNGFHENSKFLTHNRVSPTALVRKCVHSEIGGYDETIRGGLEDWEFWLRSADAGRWGGTIPEFLDWYRRRASHNDHWANWDGGERQAAFEKRLRERFPRLSAGAWPQPADRWHAPFEDLRRQAPFENPLDKAARRLVVIGPWLRMGGADKFNLDLLGQLARRGWEVTILTTLCGDHSWMHEFQKLTPDVFALGHFVRPSDMPAAMVYFVRSRRPDAVLVTNSELGYHALHHLRACCPEPAYLDLTHMEEDYWKNGGYPRYSVSVQGELDLSVVVSEHLKRWMVARGAQPDRVEVCHINVEPSQWAPDPERRQTMRRRHGIAEGSVVLLYPGRLTAQKQPRVFAKTLLELHKRGVPFEAIVAGDGEDRPWLEAFLRQHGLAASVRILGLVPLDSMPGLMSAADVLFLPSKAEGISLVLYEAMAGALPVVGADVGGQRELLTPECGVLLPYLGDEDREADAYADALAALIADAPARERMGRAGRARILEKFTLDRMGDRMESLIAAAIERRTRAPRPILDPVLAFEIATRGVEYVRSFGLVEWLWHERVTLQARAARAAGLAEPSPGTTATTGAVLAELAQIESSPGYRLIQRAKSTMVYRALARLRFGPNWDLVRPGEDPGARLARIKTSRSYRMVRAMKSVGIERWYAGRGARGLPGHAGQR